MERVGIREMRQNLSRVVSSARLIAEGRRAAARCGSLALDGARAAPATITLLPVDDPTLEAAAGLDVRTSG